MLRVGRKNRKEVRDSMWLSSLLILEFGFKFLKRLAVVELLVADDLTDETIARNDIAFDNLSETFKVIVIADNESASDSGTFRLISLSDVDMHNLILPELPSECNDILASGRWTEEVVTVFSQKKLGDGPAGADVLELFKGNSSRDKSTCLLTRIFLGEVVVLQVCLQNLCLVNSETVS